MDIAHERLSSLIEFAKQSALMQKTPSLTVAQHRAFNAYESRVQSLPGIQLGVQSEGEGEIWLRLERLHESRPPRVEEPLLSLWIVLSASPDTSPRLLDQVPREDLIAIGMLAADVEPDASVPTEMVTAETPAPAQITLKDYEQADTLNRQLEIYLREQWTPWAEQERLRRKSIALYSELFLLAQEVQGNLGDTKLELVWGLAVATWQNPRVGRIEYPLITVGVELSVNEKTMAIEIRPRSNEPRLETDAYMATDVSTVGAWNTKAKEFFKSSELPINPLEPSTFEPVTRMASTLLDAEGVYVPATASLGDRGVPKAGEHLAVTDTWVLFARPRDSSLFVKDLERFEARIQGSPELPPALSVILNEPVDTVDETPLPAYRGLSPVPGSGNGTGAGPVQELYFPKPYNDEQVQIIQRLEASDGVVVQGPPGTGKTHTIANVICHYLANGKRVLVTSMKDPALAVLRDKIPEDIRPLAISLLSSEADSMRQFQFSIERIAAEVQRIDRAAYTREIKRIDGDIDQFHAQLAAIDYQIRDWAAKNLSDIRLEEEVIRPVEAAEAVAGQQEALQLIPDRLGIEAAFRPQFDAQDLLALREARQQVGEAIAYVGQRLPALETLPEVQHVLQAHQDLADEAQLRQKESAGEVPRLNGEGTAVLERLNNVLARVAQLRDMQSKLADEAHPWIPRMQACLRTGESADILGILRELLPAFVELSGERKDFVARPVEVPFDCAEGDEMGRAIVNLAEGRRPFGIAGWLGKSAQKDRLDSIRILGSKPQSADEWGFVLRFLRFQARCVVLIKRWNALASELPLPSFAVQPQALVEAVRVIDLLTLLEEAITLAKELASDLQVLLPGWTGARQFESDLALQAQAEQHIRHHLTRSRLAIAWATKEKLHHQLEGCEGEISARLRAFISDSLGNPGLTGPAFQERWTQLIDQLHQVLAHRDALGTIERVTTQIKSSGAPLWAEQLRRTPSTAPVDPLVPGNALQLWRLQRLASHLDAINGRHELKRLYALRQAHERDLARLYQDAVVKRTWLRLAENATPKVKAALESYRAAIRRIGKGTGVRAGRYRKDAQEAAETANTAIPCWIMPHHRVSESLPVEFGLFDLVIIDEASQSDLTALPSLLRAKKVLIVGDDKQVSPEGIGLEEERMKGMINLYLGNQVALYRPQMTPDRSMYDLFKVAFAESAVMLREHFRCVAPIIEYSRQQFYKGELKPLRLPTLSERLDPPLIDLQVLDGVKQGKVNKPEAHVIVDEIRRIVEAPEMSGRTIGVVSLLGSEQARLIMELLSLEMGEEIISRYQINCGDARTFQGKERDIMFLSMVSSPGDVHAQTRENMQQRFNVAASRARDRMYLVRSVSLDDLSPADSLRRGLIQHFETPFARDEAEVADLRGRCESGFERDLYDVLTERGYRVTPQVAVGAYRIDLVVEGDNDGRLAIECDGDRYHGPDVWDADMRRQRILERAGWRFWRCFASAYTLRRQVVLQDLFETLESMGIGPSQGQGAAPSLHVEHRKVFGFPSARESDDPIGTVETPMEVVGSPPEGSIRR